MVALQKVEVVANQVILSIPEASARLLGVHVVRNERVGVFPPNLDRSTQATNRLDRRPRPIPLPPVVSVVVAEIAREMGRDRGRQASHEVAGVYGIGAQRSQLTLRTCHDAAHIHLGGVGAAHQPVIAVARHEMPVFGEVVVHAKYPVVVPNGQRNRAFIADCVLLVANRNVNIIDGGRVVDWKWAPTTDVVAGRHHRPQLSDNGIQSDTTGIAQLVAAGAAHHRRSISNAIDRDRRGVEVEGYPSTATLNLDDPRPHQV